MESPDYTEERVSRWLAEWLAQQLGLRATAIPVGRRFADLALSSLQAVELSGDLRRWTGVDLAPTIVYEHPAIDLLARHVADAVASRDESSARAHTADATITRDEPSGSGMAHCSEPPRVGRVKHPALQKSLREIPEPDPTGRSSTKAIVLEDVMSERGVSTPYTSKPAGIEPDPGARYEPFPLTPVQAAYWIGRSASFELGNIGAHCYIEFDLGQLPVSAEPLNRLESVWGRLIDRHDMLRTVVLPNGTQRTLPEVPPYRITSEDLSSLASVDADQRARAIREELSHQLFRPDRWPLFEIRITWLPRSQGRLHFSIDLLIVDFSSLQLLLGEMFELLRNPNTNLEPLEISFRDYVLTEQARREGAVADRSRMYWLGRLDHLPPSPQLPLATAPQEVRKPRFVRRDAELNPLQYKMFTRHATQINVTPSVALMTAFAEILATWSRRSSLSLNLTLFNRVPLHPQVDRLLGDFTSLTLLAVHDARRGSFAERAAAVQAQLYRDLEHRDYSALDVMRDLARHHGVAQAGLMPVVFTSALTRQQMRASVPITWSYIISQTPQVWLDHQIFDHNGALYLSWDAVDQLFPSGMIDDMFAAYVEQLERLAGSDQAWHASRDSLTPRAQVTRHHEANDSAATFPADLLQSGFWREAARRPEAPSVVTTAKTLSYDELAGRAGRVASLLRDRRAQPNRLVAIAMERGWEQVVAVLGVLTAGAAYLPIEPDLPTERIRHVMDDGEVDIVLTQSWVDAGVAWPKGVERIHVDAAGLGDTETHTPLQTVDDLAYVMYTSGSTGSPKGVMIAHASAFNTVFDVNDRFGLTNADRVLAVSSLSFDLSVWDIFGVLATGGTVVIPEHATRKDPSRWSELIEQHGVTVWNSVPALMELLIDRAERVGGAALRSLRLVLLSGDWIPVGLPERLRAFAPDAQVVSLGGATEAAIWSIFFPIQEVDPSWKSVPYGRPMRNQHVYVLGDDFELRPTWVPGDIYIAGRGLAKGYWRDDAQTAERFITHPHSGERLYRTGDLGRYMPDSTIEFLGREDFQVKIHGCRIELGEVEAALERHPAVQMAMALADGNAGQKRLVGYVRLREGVDASPRDIRDFAAGILPSPSVPSQIIRVDMLPLTPNGKVDRRALAGLGARESTTVAPDGDVSPGLVESLQALIRDITGLA
jgi:amino acid adenylation domain-containing protein